MALEDFEDSHMSAIYMEFENVFFHSMDIMLSVYCSDEEKPGEQMITE